MKIGNWDDEEARARSAEGGTAYADWPPPPYVVGYMVIVTFEVRVFLMNF